jgi:hypothetical protein
MLNRYMICVLNVECRGKFFLFLDACRFGFCHPFLSVASEARSEGGRFSSHVRINGGIILPLFAIVFLVLRLGIHDVSRIELGRTDAN